MDADTAKLAATFEESYNLISALRTFANSGQLIEQSLTGLTSSELDFLRGEHGREEASTWASAFRSTFANLDLALNQYRAGATFPVADWRQGIEAEDETLGAFRLRIQSLANAGS
ncbi:MAG: hypothetical protein WDM88_13175 [Galbitalea sp.]